MGARCAATPCGPRPAATRSRARSPAPSSTTRRTADVTADARARSPLADRATNLATIGAELMPFLAQVDLRVDPAYAGLAPYPLPIEPNTAVNDGRRAALWLGPDEWLVLGPPGAATEIVAELDTAFE